MAAELRKETKIIKIKRNEYRVCVCVLRYYAAANAKAYIERKKKHSLAKPFAFTRIDDSHYENRTKTIDRYILYTLSYMLIIGIIIIISMVVRALVSFGQWIVQVHTAQKRAIERTNERRVEATSRRK